MRLLVVDDSALMRRHLRQTFEAEADVEVDLARNGIEALERLRLTPPDVITLDVNMPELDGLSCLKAIMRERPTPVVMVSSLTEAGAEVTLRALELGAVDFVPKPDGTVSLSIDRIRAMLVEKVRAAARTEPRRLRPSRTALPPGAARTAPQSPARALPVFTTANGVVLIGVSTGGPRTLEDILPELPASFPWPVVVAQHMPSTFTGVFARRMDNLCALTVVEVSGPVPLQKGHVYIGRGDADIVLERRLGRIVVTSAASDESLWHPSVDRLVSSATEIYSARSLIGVQLTGMGSDGAAAMAELKRRGGRTIAESDATAVVFGMPQELIKREGASVVLPCGRVAAQLMDWMRAGERG